MFSQLRNILKVVSGPKIYSQLFVQNCTTELARIIQRHHSVLSTQFSLTQHCPAPNHAHAISDKKSLLSSTPVIFQSVRTKVRVYYKGSAWKRYNKHNIENRLTTQGGLMMLWRKVLKGRHKLASYERILPNTVNGLILPEHHFKYTAHPLTKRRLPKPGLF